MRIFEHQSCEVDAPHKRALNIAHPFIPNRRHVCCLFQAALGPLWDTHRHAYCWARIFSAFANPATCDSSSVFRGIAWRLSVVRSTFRCFFSLTLRHGMDSLYPASTQKQGEGKHCPHQGCSHRPTTSFPDQNRLFVLVQMVGRRCSLPANA